VETSSGAQAAAQGDAMKYSLSRRRAAFTILEVGVLMTLSVLLVSLGVVIFSSLLQAQRQTLQRDRLRRELMRLDHLFRRDVHAATEAKVSAPSSCELTDAQGNRWHYQANDLGIVREHHQGDELKQREVFRFLPGSDMKLTLESSGSRMLLNMNIDLPQASGRSPGRHPSYQGRALIGGLQPAGPQEEQP
jgi:hypothetical protein